MKRIYAPTSSPEDWKQFLAEPDKQWRAGYSAMTLARSWEAAEPDLPPEVAATLASSGDPRLYDLALVLAIPEYQVDLPGSRRPSQTDVFALARNDLGLAAIAVEGKVDEAFGPTVGERLDGDGASQGVKTRMAYLLDTLGLPSKIPPTIRYQLLHRTVSALLIAREFHASTAAMLVHSFSPTGKWFEDYQAFLELFGQKAEVNDTVKIGDFANTPLFIGWAKGNQAFRTL